MSNFFISCSYLKYDVFECIRFEKKQFIYRCEGETNESLKFSIRTIENNFRFILKSLFGTLSCSDSIEIIAATLISKGQWHKENKLISRKN